jgi:hypothetical protein
LRGLVVMTGIGVPNLDTAASAANDASADEGARVSVGRSLGRLVSTRESGCLDTLERLEAARPGLPLRRVSFMLIV